MTLLSGVWLAPCHASSIRSPPISRVRRSLNVSVWGRSVRVVVPQQQPPGLLVPDPDDVLAEERGRAGMVGVVMGVDEVRHLVAHAVGLCDLVDRPLEVVPDARRGIEEDDAVRRRQEGRLIDAVGDPVQVPLDAADVVALRVGRRPEGRCRDRGIVGKAGELGFSIAVVAFMSDSVLWSASLGRVLSVRSGQPAQGKAIAPTWLRIAARSSKAHCSLIRPSSVTR